MTCRGRPEWFDRHKVGALHLSSTHHSLLVVSSSVGYFSHFSDFQLREWGQWLTTDTEFTYLQHRSGVSVGTLVQTLVFRLAMAPHGGVQFIPLGVL